MGLESEKKVREGRTIRKIRIREETKKRALSMRGTRAGMPPLVFPAWFLKQGGVTHADQWQSTENKIPMHGFITSGP